MLICNGPLKMPSTIKKDVTGAVSAATITLPMLIGYSITAFAVPGGDFVPQVAVIGLIATIFSGFLLHRFLGEMEVLAGFSDEKMEMVENRLLPETYKKVEGIIRASDRDRDLSGYLRITYNRTSALLRNLTNDPFYAMRFWM